MSSTVKVLCFIVLLPFFAAIGHDFYVNYLATPEQKAKLSNLEIDPSKYMASDFGYLLGKYTPGLMQMGREEIDPVTWKNNIDPILQQDTYLVALAPAVLFFAYLLIAYVAGIPPFRGRRFGKNVPTSNYDGVFKNRDQANQMKYTRK
jgi:hypothetical protein